jgi:hypothetical protein
MPPLYLRNTFFLSRKPGPLHTTITLIDATRPLESVKEAHAGNPPPLLAFLAKCALQ